MAVETPAYLANSDLRGCNLLASCYRKLGLRVKLMAAKMQYVGVRGLGGVPSLRGKLLEAHTDIHTISAMRLPRGRWGDYSPFICGFAPPSTLKYLRVLCGITWTTHEPKWVLTVSGSFNNYNQLRDETRSSLHQYNTERPHDSLFDLIPIVSILAQRGPAQIHIPPTHPLAS